jgi:hypothetical protein
MKKKYNIVRINKLTIIKRNQYFIIAKIIVDCKCFHYGLHCSVL